MILADKIIRLRKKAGWSQEELAERLGVTRQSVSKWEGAQSVPVCILLVLVAIACYAFVYGGTYQNAMKRLLEEGDYTRASKARSKLLGTVSGCYWLVVTAIFLFYTFGPNGNGQPQYSWFIWAVAGVLFGAVVMAVKVLWKGPEK